MPYYQTISGANKSLNLNALDSTKFPSTGGDYACSTSTSEPYHTATNYYSGSTQIRCNYAGQYTLTCSVTNASYMSSYSVSRATSPERAAATGAIVSNPANGATAAIYKGDTLTIAATAASTSYSSYNFSSLSAPTLTVNSQTQITVSNPNTVACTVYMGTSSSSITTSKGTIAAKSGTTNGTLAITGLTAGTTYYFVLKATPTRTKYTYSVGTKTLSSATVNGNVTATFSASRTSTSENGSVVTSGSANATTSAAAGSWNVIWTGSQALEVGTDPGDPSMAYGTTTIRGLSHNITSSTPLKVYVTTTYGNSSWVSASNEPVKFSESRKSGGRTRYCESSVWAPDYASSTSVTITARFDDQSSGGLLLFPSIKATKIQAYY